jgi:hypothetical protein
MTGGINIPHEKGTILKLKYLPHDLSRVRREETSQ